MHLFDFTLTLRWRVLKWWKFFLWNLPSTTLASICQFLCNAVFVIKRLQHKKRCGTTCAAISAMSCASHCAINIVTLSPDTKRLLWNVFMLRPWMCCDRIRQKQNLWLFLIRKSGTQFNQCLRLRPNQKERMHYNFYDMLTIPNLFCIYVCFLFITFMHFSFCGNTGP
jgi:hypothetical protein